MTAMLSGVPGSRLMSPAGLGGGVADCAAAIAGAGACADAGPAVCGMLAMSSFSASCTEKRNNCK